TGGGGVILKGSKPHCFRLASASTCPGIAHCSHEEDTRYLVQLQPRHGIQRDRVIVRQILRGLEDCVRQKQHLLQSGSTLDLALAKGKSSEFFLGAITQFTRR